jgi:hypothetical protein
MAYYLVKAKANREQLDDLKERLDRQEILQMRPFGQALDYSLKNARVDPQGWTVWEEEDYCHPPLAMERAAVLDTYFTDLSVEKVKEGAGWQRIEHLNKLWQE